MDRLSIRDTESKPRSNASTSVFWDNFESLRSPKVLRTSRKALPPGVFALGRPTAVITSGLGLQSATLAAFCVPGAHRNIILVHGPRLAKLYSPHFGHSQSPASFSHHVDFRMQHDVLQTCLQVVGSPARCSMGLAGFLDLCESMVAKKQPGSCTEFLASGRLPWCLSLKNLRLQRSHIQLLH